MSAARDADLPSRTAFWPRLSWHVTDLMRLAWPVMLSRAGILAMAFCDVVMLGRYEPGAVGVANLGLAIFIPLLVMSIGLCSGVVAVVSRAYGAGEWVECGRAWRRAMVWGTVVSLMAASMVWQAEDVLLLFGQEAGLSEAGGDVAQALAPGLIAQVLFAICAFYLEATRRPLVALAAMIGANLINLALNWLLIYGSLGAPELGAVGAAIASTLARFAAMAGMVLAILWQPSAQAAGVRGPWETFWGPGGWRAGALMRKLGVSAGLSNGFETLGFAAMTLFAGQISLAALDAYSIAHNLTSTVFMVGLGMAIAAGVRVGIEVGRNRPSEAAFAGWSGLGTAFVVLAMLGTLIAMGQDVIAAVYTNDPELRVSSAFLIALSALIFVPDTAQVVLGQAVRALGDAWVPIGVYALSFVVLLIPAGWLLGIHWGLGAQGLIFAIVGSCVLASGLLAWRFAVLTRSVRPDQP
ncbi:MAG: MATE family efflux transporter [Pseudomonadota bacterium]